MQPPIGEVFNALEQVPPHRHVADQPMQATIGSAAAEKSVGVHGKENGKNLVVGKTLQPWQVVPSESADVCLLVFIKGADLEKIHVI